MFYWTKRRKINASVAEQIADLTCDDMDETVTGQLADKPTRGQSSRGLVNSRTSQLAEMFEYIIALSVISDR